MQTLIAEKAIALCREDQEQMMTAPFLLSTYGLFRRRRINQQQNQTATKNFSHQTTNPLSAIGNLDEKPLFAHLRLLLPRCSGTYHKEIKEFQVLFRFHTEKLT